MLKESLEIHDKLNQKLFDGEKLRPEIREKILEAADAFVDSLEIKPDILDIQLLGSNASYNYTDNSDIDVDLIVNFELINPNVDMVQSLYWLSKEQFNRNYDITIKGMPLEFYIEDVRSGAVSNGVYSILNNQWIKFPKRIDNIPEYDLSRLVSVWKSKIERTLKSNDKEELKLVLNNLLMIRKNSIAIDGEFGKGNQLYKELRNMGLIDEIKHKLKELRSKELSLESIVEDMTVGMMLKQDF